MNIEWDRPWGEGTFWGLCLETQQPLLYNPVWLKGPLSDLQLD